MTASRPRTRLSPQARREQLLDTAGSMVTEEGVQAFTMEGLARAAGVSAPLVYNYFAGRTELLRSLLVREYEQFVATTVERLREADGFEDIVRISVTSNFDHHAPGNVLPLLMNQPEIVSASADEQGRQSRQNARFLVRAAAETYRLTTERAGLAVSMASGASIAAAELAATTGLDRDQAIEAAVQYILAGIERMAEAGEG